MDILTFVRSYLLLACFIILPSCANQRSGLKEQKPQTYLDNELEYQVDGDVDVATVPWITVWIHGTQPSFDKAPGKRLRAALKRRAHEVFYCKSGLHPINTQPKTNRHHEFARLLQQVDPLRFPAAHFYTFGWSGDLSFDVRYQAGKNLYLDLIKLVEEFTHTHGVTPNIRLITHSHGGNVALNLALAHAEYRKNRALAKPRSDSEHYPIDELSEAEYRKRSNLVVNELVLLACPVQEKTAFLAQDQLFKKIYSLYSSLDVLQVVDPQGLYKNNTIDNGVFSKRRFPASFNKVAQAKIRFNKRAILHIEFLSDRLVRALPSIITKLDRWHQVNVYDAQIKQICIQHDTGQASDLRCSYVHTHRNRVHHS